MSQARVALRHAADGHAVLSTRNVAIKQAASNKLNQVRPVASTLPRALSAARTYEPYVVTPDQIVRLVAGKKHGQHTENPFESVAALCSKHHRIRSAGSGGAIRDPRSPSNADEREQRLRDAMTELRKPFLGHFESWLRDCVHRRTARSRTDGNHHQRILHHRASSRSPSNWRTPPMRSRCATTGRRTPSSARRTARS